MVTYSAISKSIKLNKNVTNHKIGSRKKSLADKIPRKKVVRRIESPQQIPPPINLYN